MKSPAITATMYGGNKTLYLQVISTYVIVLNNLFKFTFLNLKGNVLTFLFVCFCRQ